MLLDILIPTLLAVHILVSLLMVFFVLMQRPKNEGLGAAFGGGMTDNLFGAQATNFLQKITVYLGGAFFALTMVLAILYAYQARKKDSVVVIDPTPAAAIAAPGASPAASPGAAPVEGAPAAASPSTAASPAASPVTDSASPATASTPSTDAAATTAPTPLTDTAAPVATPAAAVESSSPAASPANP